MRIIKFRQYDLVNKKMIQLKELKLPWEQKRDGIIVMMFTGLSDKLGKEIYEGDIVKSEWGGAGDVAFEGGAFVYRFESGEFKCWVSKENTKKRNLEVRGNIYENPKLLDLLK